MIQDSVGLTALNPTISNGSDEVESDDSMDLLNTDSDSSRDAPSVLIASASIASE